MYQLNRLDSVDQTDQSLNPAGVGPGSAPYGAHGLDVSSVVTQVTKQQALNARPVSYRSAQLRLPTWKDRLKGLLCCFAPERGGYLKAGDQYGLSSRSSPPRLSRNQPLLGRFLHFGCKFVKVSICHHVCPVLMFPRCPCRSQNSRGSPQANIGFRFR